MKNIISKFLVLTLMLALVFGLSVQGFAAEEPIKIGLMSTMTTTLAASLPWEHVGYELAVKRINESGGINGRMIELVPKDTGNDPSITVERMEQLKSEGVVAIVGPSSDSLAPAAAEWADKNKMVTITTGTSSTKISIENASKYFFSSGFNAWQIGKLLATQTVGELGFESFAFIGTDGAAPNDVRSFFLQQARQIDPDFKDLGDYRVDTSNTEFSTLVSAIAAVNPDMLLGGIAGPSFISMVEQARMFGLFERCDYYGWYTADASNTQPFGENYPIGKTHGMIALPFWFETEESKEFVADWIERGKELGYEDTIYPADLGYGMYKAFMSLAEALKAVDGEFTGDKIAEAMLEIKVDLPYGEDAYYREFDHMLITNVWYGTTAWSEDWVVPIATDLKKYGEESYPTRENFYKEAESRGIDIDARLGLK